MDENIDTKKIGSLKNFISDFAVNLNERLRLPVFQYYVVVLIFYNWDLLLYLLFDSKTILLKIDYIKANFYSPARYLIPLLVAILYSVIFPILQFYLIRIQKSFDKKRTLWSQESQTENANHKKNIQNILSGIKEKEDFLKQLEYEKSRYSIAQSELENLRNENLLLQKASSDSVTEGNDLRQSYYSIVSNFKFFLKTTGDISKDLIEKYGDDTFFRNFNILIEIYKLSEINNNAEVENKFPQLLYDFLLNKENVYFSDNTLVDENIKKHISQILLKNKLTTEVATSTFGNIVTQSQEFSEFVNFVKDFYSF